MYGGFKHIFLINKIYLVNCFIW